MGVSRRLYRYLVLGASALMGASAISSAYCSRPSPDLIVSCEDADAEPYYPDYVFSPVEEPYGQSGASEDTAMSIDEAVEVGVERRGRPTGHDRGVSREDHIAGHVQPQGWSLSRLIERLHMIGTAEAAVPDEYESFRELLTFEGVSEADVPDPHSMRQDPSHRRAFPVEDDYGGQVDRGLTVIGKWVNYQLETGTQSHLYAFVQDADEMLVTFHWYLCRSREVSRVTEVCQPLVSFFVDQGELVQIGYYRNGAPRMPWEVQGPADFSQWSEQAGYVGCMDVLSVIQDRSLALDQGPDLQNQ